MTIGTSLKRFGADRRGVAAVEFAIIAPLLVLILGISVEIGRMTIFQQRFEMAVVGVSRHVARYPEYEVRARKHAVPVLASLFPQVDLGALDIVVYSLLKEKGALQEVFPGHILVGDAPGLDWRDSIRAASYVDDEAVIFVGATYDYAPIFPLVPSVFLRFEKAVTILPSFSRKFPWNEGQVDESLYVY